MMFKWPWHLGALDSGPVFSGYLGLVLYSAAAVAIGLLDLGADREPDHRVLRDVRRLLFVLHMVGGVADGVPQRVGARASSRSSASTPGSRPSRAGMIDTRDVVYFVSITVGCLMVAFRALERRKWA